MKKRIVSILLIVAMVISLIPSTILGVFATSTSQPIISVENVWAAAGSLVEVNVEISDNPGIYGATLTVSWAEGLALVDAESGDVFNGLSYQEPSRYVSAGTNFIWYGTRLREIKDGTVLKLTFEVAENMEDAEELAVNVTGNGLTDVDDNVISARFISGSVRIVNYIPGDTDGNDEIDPRDLIALAKYISDNCTTDPEGFNVTINTSAADVDDDGKLIPKDLVLIAKYISDGCTTDPEGFNVILKPSTPKCPHVGLEEVSAKPATCTEPGNIAYWYCDDCTKYFGDDNATVELAYDQIKLNLTDHALNKVDAKAPTVDENGNQEYWKCADCDACFSDENAQNKVTEDSMIQLAVPSYTITFVDEKNWPDGNKVKFAQSEALLLNTYAPPAVDGYKWLGWYTKSIDGDLVDNIQACNTEDKILYAHWEAESYTIIYKDAPSHANKPQYTIEDEVILSDPEWPGLIFAEWIDEDGNPITKISKGSTGPIQVTATWREKENYAVPTKGIRELWVHYNEKYSQQYFVYDLGTIHNVVLETFRTKAKMLGESIDWSYTNEVSFEQSNSEAASKAITHSVSKTTEWSNTTNWAKNHSDTFERGFTVGGEWAPIKDVLSFNLSGEFNWSDTDEESWGTASTNGESINDSEEFSDSYSSTVTFNKTVTESITTTTHIGEQMPAGTYRNVAYGSVRVFAVVTYDVTSGNYRVDTFSVLSDEIGEMTLYEPPVESNIRIQANAGLPLDVPLGELEAYMDKAYYVQYDANGGSGSMMISAHISGEKHKLSDNLFTKEGYTWTGWKLADGKIVTDGSEVSDLAASGELITAAAEWSANPYIVTLDPNEGTVGTATVQLTYDSTYGTLPTPVRTGYTFNGWEFGDNIITSETKVSFVGAHTLVAQWTANTYTVTFKANGGTGNDKTATYTYDTNAALSANSYTRANYTFLGWSTNSKATTPTYSDKQTVKNLAASGNVTLYAIWVRTGASANFTAGNKTRDVYLSRGSSHTETVSTEMSKAALTANGYKNIEITIVFDAQRNFLIQYNKAKVEVVTDSGSLKNKSWETSDFSNNSWTQDKSVTFTIEVSKLNDDGSFKLKWSTVDDGGSADDGWYLGETNVTVTAKK